MNMNIKEALSSDFMTTPTFVEKRPRKKKSKYDEYFTRNGELAECRICQIKVSWSKKGGTNSLRLHLSTRHKEIFEKLSIDDMEYKRLRGIPTNSPTPIQPTPPPLQHYQPLEETKPFVDQSMMLNPPPPPVTPTPHYVPRSLAVRLCSGTTADITEIDNALMVMICNNQVPVKLLESRDFATVLRMIPENFVLQPLDYYIQFTLPLLVTNIEDKIRFELSCPTKLAISIDLFSPENSKNQVCVINAAYMNPETMIPKQVLIDYKVFPKEYGNMDFLMSRVPNLIDTRLKSLTITSHAQFSQHAAEGLNESGPLPSFTDLLNEIMHESFAQDLPLIKKQKEILQECLQSFETYGLTLANSTTGLSEEVLKSNEKLGWAHHKEVIEMIFDAAERRKLLGDESFEKKFFNLTPNEFEISKLMHAIYKKFDGPIKYISHRYYPTAGWIIPTLRVLWHDLTQLNEENGSNNTRLILEVLLPALQSKFEKCQSNMILKTATFLDPRFRGNFFTVSHEAYMQEKFEELDRKLSSDDADIDIKPAEYTSWHHFAQKGTSGRPRNLESFAKELRDYAHEHINLNIDPSDYWMMCENKFPLMKMVASEYLAIPASATRARECYEAGQRICPLNEENLMAHQKLAYCYANLEEYGTI